jgi:hypothetical protein
MQTERSLSDFWREDKSDDRVMELASVLRGADSLIGVMGSGVGVTWSMSGQSGTWWLQTKAGQPAGMKVVLDYSPVAALQPPFGGRSVDEIIGYAAHEGGHCLWSDGNSRLTVDAILSRRVMPTTRASRPHDDKNPNCWCPTCQILRIQNILEDAYIDFHVAETWPVLGEYIRWARLCTAKARPIDLDAIACNPKLARNSVINLWIACSLYDAPLPAKMCAKVKRAMTFLMSKSVQAVQNKRPDVRSMMAVECWEYLAKEFPREDEPLPRQVPPQSQPPAQPQPQEPSDENGEKGGGEGGSAESEEGDKEGGEGGKGAGEGDDEGDEEGEGAGDGDQDTKPDTGEDESEAGEGSEEPDTGEDTGEDEGGESGGAEGGDEGEEEGGGDEGGEPEGEGDEDTYNKEADDKGEGEGGGDEAKGDAGQQEGGKNRPQADDSEQGGDELGAPGNLDEFDLHDLTEVPEKLLEEVMDAISHEIEDLSQSVSEALDHHATANTRIGDYAGPAADKVRAAVEPQIQKMRRVFDRQAMVKSRQIKGMTSGKLDARSLARVGTGNLRVYKRREVLDKPNLAVGLLLDVSGSMSSPVNYMPVVWATACVFAEALIRKPGVNFLALTYTGSGWIMSDESVQTTRICDRDLGKLCIGNVEQGGGTPSGPAIASIKVLMDRMPERQKVIIHFTDGSPDNANSVLKAVENARKYGYAVWAIGLRGMEATLSKQYGDGNWETMASVRELPDKVAELVKRLVISR